MTERLKRGWMMILVLAILALFLTDSTYAKTARTPQKQRTSEISKKAPAAKGVASSKTADSGQSKGPYDAQSVVLMDGLSGQVLCEQNPRLKMAPASFVKVLTLYLAFDALRAGQLKMEDLVTVSEKAWRIQGSKMFLKVGDRVKVEDLLKGIAVASGNDACVALAEHMAGSEEAFVARMNEKAAEWGMKESTFINSHGMPAPGQLTTAMEMAFLAKRYVEDHPEALAYHSTLEFAHNGIRQGNRNTLLQRYPGVDGLKTGHVEESGYHLLATAKRERQRLIAVVMGCDRMRKRAEVAQALLEYGFKNFTSVEAVKKGSSFGPLKVKRGKVKEVALTATESAWVTVPKGKEETVSATPQWPSDVVAPVQQGQVLAKVLVQNEGKLIKRVNLIASTGVEKSLIPPWPVLLAVVAGLFVLGFGSLRWFRRPKQRKKF